MRAIKQFAHLSRTLKLLQSFPQEQKNPAKFYIPLAQDTLILIELFQQYHRMVKNQSNLAHDDKCNTRHSTILDVGGGPGFFSQVFAEAGWHYTSVDVDAGDFEKYGYSDARNSSSHAATISPIHIRASGYQLPFQDDSFDVVLCSNVAEHVSDPWGLAEELLRVVRPNGLLFFSYTVWFGPFGGHETGLWHYLGGHFAARRYQRKYGKLPKNHYGISLFRVDAQAGVHWAQRMQRERKADILGLFPRYHPWWMWCIVYFPVLRELLTSNLMIALVKRRSRV